MKAGRFPIMREGAQRRAPRVAYSFSWRPKHRGQAASGKAPRVPACARERWREHQDQAGLRGLEETERLGAVADQEILGLLVVVEHDAMGLAADAGLLVAAEGGVGGIEVVAVGPDGPAWMARPK